jgi:hypothetical protein
MQRIYRSPWTPEEYESQEGWRHVIPESTCSNCHQAVTLHHHGRYQRWVATLLAKVLYLWIARFLCPLCRHTISYLPDFALTYRVLGTETLQGFLERKLDRPDVRTFLDLSTSYKRRLYRFAPELIRTVGAGLGVPPPRSLQGFWPWLKKAGKGLRPLTRRLVTDFKIGLLKRYRCHQPARP